MVVVGPGLSLEEKDNTTSQGIDGGNQKAIDIDGDGLTAITANISVLQKKITYNSHAASGEMARLSKSVAEIDKNKIAILQEAAKISTAPIVLKARIPDWLSRRRSFGNLSGNAGMASAGSGDVLTGCIAAMYGLGLKPQEATRKACSCMVWQEFSCRKKGMDGITARDIMEYLPAALKKTVRAKLITVITRFGGNILGIKLLFFLMMHTCYPTSTLMRWAPQFVINKAV